MTLVRRISGLFVTPAGESVSARGAEVDPRPAPEGGYDTLPPTGTPARHRPPPVVAVLALPSDAAALGAALGLALARDRRVPVAVLCVWSPEPIRSGWRAPPLPAAARVVASLRARGHEASAAGRLAVVTLSTSCEEAASQALRVSAAAGTAPTVLALAGPRAAAFDELLAMQDLVVVAVAPSSDAALARLATAGLERVLTCAMPSADPARAIAAAGLTLLPSTRRALAAPVAALS